MKRRTLIVGGLVALLIALPVGWYFGSPWWTLWRMREAARAGDWKTLGSYVDAGALEAEAKAQARSLWGFILANPPRTQEGRARIAQRARQELGLIGVKPQTGLDDVRVWLANLPVRWGGLGPSSSGRMSPYVVHHGLSAFEVRERGLDRETGPLLTFHREGLGWKLVGLRWGQQ